MIYPAADDIGSMCAAGWLAHYVKEVDASETTLRFWQEIYDHRGQLAEIHEKFPVDKGHRQA
jgi:hypothetical protein